MKYIILFFLILTTAQAQDHCEYLRKSANPVDKSINIVIVPSGFGDNTEEFASTVRDLWKDVEKV